MSAPTDQNRPGPRLSVVIVNWNTRELLDRCLASLPAAVGDLTHEVLVVDNDSADGSAAWVREHHRQVRLLEAGGNLGFTGGNNLAFTEANGEYVLLLNPDTICPSGSLANLVRFADGKPRLGAAGPTLTDEMGLPTITYGCFPREAYHLLELLGSSSRRWPPLLRGYGFTKTPRSMARSSRVDYVAGACMLIPRSVLEEIGALDERFFMYFEETDWSLRAWRAGYEIWHDADTSIVHLEGRAAARASRFSLAQFHKSYRLFVAKHHGRWRTYTFRAALCLENSAKAAYRGLLAIIGARNRAENAAVARDFWFVARLQLRGQIEAVPPTR